MTTSSGKYVGIAVSKEKLDVAVLGEFSLLVCPKYALRLFAFYFNSRQLYNFSHITKRHWHISG
jgi:hypothetical protein